MHDLAFIVLLLHSRFSVGRPMNMDPLRLNSLLLVLVADDSLAMYLEFGGWVVARFG